MRDRTPLPIDPHVALAQRRGFDGPMGMAKREIEEIEARGWAEVGTTICSECVVDSALVDAIREHAGEDICDYCKRVPARHEASAPFDLIVELVVNGLKFEYEDPVEHMAWENGYVGTVHDTWDLLWELGITQRDDVHESLHRSIAGSEWCQRDPYATTPADALTWGWRAFRKFVKHHRRFTFLTTDHSMAAGAGEIPMHAVPAAITQAVAEAGLVKELSTGSEWWRLRPHPATESYSSAADLGPPPDILAQDNRMTPKGMGAFYGASTEAGARAEVRGYAREDQDGSSGKFLTATPLTIIDLRNLPNAPSLFDARRRNLRATISFLHDFVENVTQVADPSDSQNLDYVPTQVVAETLRYTLATDGIIWRSSKNRDVSSCVLFISNTEVSEQGTGGERTRLLLDPSTVTRVDAPL